MIYIEKKKLSRSQFDFIETELLSANEDGIIDMDQLELMLNKYEPRFNFDRIETIKLFGFGIILLSVIATVIFNWSKLWTPLRVVFLIAMPVTFFAIYIRMKNITKKDLKYLLYIGTTLTAIGIIASETLFSAENLHGNQWAFCAIALILIAKLISDRWIYLSSIVICIFFNLFSIGIGSFPFLAIVLLPILIYLENEFKRDFGMVIANNIAVLTFLISVLLFFKVPIGVIGIIGGIVGLLYYSFPFGRSLSGERLFGLVTVGIAGISLAYEGAWKSIGLTNYSSALVIIVLLIMIISMIYMMKEEKLGSFIFLGIFSFRLYSETLDKILPKEIMFIILGALLIYLSLKFEKRTRIAREKFKDD